MPHYQLICAENRAISVEFEGKDPHSALSVALANNLGDSELWGDGKYVCTLRQAPEAHGGYWMIVQKHGLGNLTKVTTYSGLEFEVRQAAADDGPILAEFWQHVSQGKVATRSIGIEDPALRDRAGAGLGAQDDRTITLLAFGGDGGVVAIAILVPDPDLQNARAMVFTRDDTTSHGISWALLGQILILAEERGIKTVTSVFAIEDVRAIRLERQMGFTETEYPGNEDLKILRWTFAIPAQLVLPGNDAAS